VVVEVISGLTPEETLRARPLLEACLYLGASFPAAALAGAWRYQFARRGITISTTDALIAATALAHNATLITGNARHYPMPELSMLPLPR
jgi:predicted nucleic acid-binding protein